jgi:hypothetical protein
MPCMPNAWTRSSTRRVLTPGYTPPGPRPPGLAQHAAWVRANSERSSRRGLAAPAARSCPPAYPTGVRDSRCDTQFDRWCARAVQRPGGRRAPSPSAKTRTPSRRKSACSTPALRSTSGSAILSSSANRFGSSHQDLDNRDENHPMAVRVNSRDFYTALGTLPGRWAAPIRFSSSSGLHGCRRPAEFRRRGGRTLKRVATLNERRLMEAYGLLMNVDSIEEAQRARVA